MASSLLVDLWRQVVSLKPGFLSRTPHFTFITVHYFWIVGLAIIGSILLFPAGGLAYVDALFFASGACTQSGLNTVDVSLLNTYQQLVLFFLPMLTNPITINTFVVFLRLYWFEKRFQHIAIEAKKNRRTISKSKSQTKGDRDIGREEMGVNGRSITVMHNNTNPASGALDGSARARMNGSHESKPGDVQTRPNGALSGDSEDSSKVDSTATDDPKQIHDPAGHQPQIKFAENVKRSDRMDSFPLSTLSRWTEQDHIAVLERQRNPQDRGVLRIPGPRDAERGMAPETLDEDDFINQGLLRRDTTLDSRRGSHSEVPPDAISAGDPTTRAVPVVKRAITIEEPHIPSHMEEKARAAAHTLGIFRLRKPRLFTGSKTHDDETHLQRPRSRANSFASFRATGSRERNEITPYLSWQPTIGRNSAFVDLTESQREELGGIEYRSLKSLALILVIYWWGFTILGLIGLLPWILYVDYYGSIVDADGQNRVWWAFFSTTSAFNDVGFTITPDSMISFNTAIWPLLLMSFLIIIGNTGFPIMLRWIIWITSKYIPVGSGFWEELRFLLDHPRRCFTLLFPSKATWWLFWILVILNGIDLLFFIILDLGNPAVTSMPVNIRILDGWFQAVSTRTAGLTCVNLAALHPGIQVSYLVMMYISVLPIAISVRRTNVYEEKSLGIYGSHDDEKQNEGEPSYVGAHLRRQLSFDLWYIFLGWFIICIVEGGRLQSNDPGFTMFTVLFEIVSAYGTVGLSLGYPGINASLSAEFGVISKLVIIAMQIRGRHRGLPYELDRAILLPSESMHEKEDHDAAMRMRRRNSAATASGDSNPLDPSNNRGKSTSRSVASFLSRLLHPGPSIPSRELDILRAEKRPASRDSHLMSSPREPGFRPGSRPVIQEQPSI